VKPWVEVAGAEAIAMAGQFLEHPQTVERRFGGVVENVQLDEINMKVILSLHDINI
jgi:hypothetical protein